MWTLRCSVLSSFPSFITFFTNYRIKRKDVLSLNAAPQAGLAHSEWKKTQTWNKHPHILSTFSTNENSLVARCQECNILQLETLTSEFLNLRSYYAMWWQLVGQPLCSAEHISLVCLRLFLGKRCFKVKISKEDKGIMIATGPNSKLVKRINWTAVSFLSAILLYMVQ